MGIHAKKIHIIILHKLTAVPCRIEWAWCSRSKGRSWSSKRWRPSERTPSGHLRLPHVWHLAPLEQPLATSRILADFLKAVT